MNTQDIWGFILVVVAFIGILCLFAVFSDKPEPRNLGDQAYDGAFRVLYNDGEWSQRMDLHTAEDYADTFGGRVFPHKFKT